MIVLDSSAVLAMIFAEPSADRIEAALVSVDLRFMSPANVLECTLRLAPSRTEDRSALLDELLSTYEIVTPPIEQEQLRIARQAFIAFGKGRHAAGLNFGDCFAYALAKHRDAPLLFVGDDFGKTDLRRAL